MAMFTVLARACGVSADRWSATAAPTATDSIARVSGAGIRRMTRTTRAEAPRSAGGGARGRPGAGAMRVWGVVATGASVSMTVRRASRVVGGALL